MAILFTFIHGVQCFVHRNLDYLAQRLLLFLFSLIVIDHKMTSECHYKIGIKYILNTYIHNWSLQPISQDLVSHTTYVCVC